MEAQWGPLDKYHGIGTTSSRGLLVSGLQLGNVFVGVQPALGVEGDPMRLLFDRWAVLLLFGAARVVAGACMGDWAVTASPVCAEPGFLLCPASALHAPIPPDVLSRSIAEASP